MPGPVTFDEAMPEKYSDNRHVFVVTEGGKHAFHCRNCGTKLVYLLPIEVRSWAAMARKFEAEHSHCRLAV